MRPDPRVLLADADRAGADIQRFIEGMDRETYVGDARTQAAVERKFEIIGEALNRLHQTYPEIADRIPPLREVVLLHVGRVQAPARGKVRIRDAGARSAACHFDGQPRRRMNTWTIW